MGRHVSPKGCERLRSRHEPSTVHEVTLLKMVGLRDQAKRLQDARRFHPSPRPRRDPRDELALWVRRAIEAGADPRELGLGGWLERQLTGLAAAGD